MTMTSARRNSRPRRRVFVLATVLILLAAFPIVPSLAAVPGVSEIETNGFENPENAYSWSMEWFKGKLYVGTARNPLCVENALIDYYYPGFGFYTPTPADGLGCAPDKYDLDLRAEIWQYTPSTNSWRQVYQSPTIDNPRAPGKPIALDIGYRGMDVIRDFWGNETLLVGGVTAAEYIPELSAIAPPRILATSDGETFAPLNGAPGLVEAAYGTQEVIGYRGLVVSQNRLFVLGSQSYTGDGAVLEIVDPLGDILVEAGEGPEILTATLEPEAIVRARRTNPSLANRRR